MAHLLIIGIPLAAATVLALLAVWRRWAPPLFLILLAGVTVRLFIAAVAARDPWQPGDFMTQFTAAIHAILQHGDPLQLPDAQWHFLPVMAYVNVAEYQLGSLLHLPWQFTGRIAPVVADIALIPLVGALAGTGRRRRAAALAYALNPVAIMICAIHSQLEPISLAFAVGAMLAARRARAAQSPGGGRAGPPARVSGALLGLAIATNSWPALLIPGLLHALPTWRSRVQAMAWTAGLPLLSMVTAPFVIGYPARYLGQDFRELLSPRGVIGDWGWTTLVTGGNQAVSPGWARLGTVILLVVLLSVWYLWRRANPVDLLAALTLAFLAGTDRLGDQYLLWPVPWEAARPSRGTQISFVAGSAWVGAGEIWLAQAANGHVWETMHVWWAFSSFAVIPFLILAMPWARRTARGGGPGRPVPARPQLAPVGGAETVTEPSRLRG